MYKAMKLRRESFFKKDMQRTMIRIIKLLKETEKENYENEIL